VTAVDCGEAVSRVIECVPEGGSRCDARERDVRALQTDLRGSDERGRQLSRTSECSMKKNDRTYLLRVDVSKDEQRAIDDFWFRERFPNKAAAVRELLRRGLARDSEENSN
jgi:hypothetical protein